MSTKDLRTLGRRVIEECNKGKAAAMTVIDETCATDIVFHRGTGDGTHGRNDQKQYFSATYDAFPDVHFTIEDIVVEGDKAVLRYTMTGTHKGAFMGIPPTNKKITTWAIEIYRFVGGKAVEVWSRSDTLSLMQQLGVVPTPGKQKQA
jgi:predicted ester cyclase